MGLGDDLMITTFASQIKKKYPDRQIVIGNVSQKKTYHSIIYENNPSISDCRKLDLNKPIFIIDYHQGNRPYIDYKKSLDANRYIWNTNFKATPGEIFFSKTELLQADKIFNRALDYWKKNNKNKYKAIIFLETSSTKSNDSQHGIKHQNLAWGYKNWNTLVDNINKSYLIIHSNHNDTKEIKGIFVPEKITFRLACALMSKCDLYLGAHGGFAHVAAALKKKAVIYFGGWVHPSILGYNSHKNIYYDSNRSPCGMFANVCDHCEEARKQITPNIIEKEIKDIFEKD